MRILKIMILAACSAAPLLADVMDTEPGVTVSTAASKDELAWHTNYDEGLSLSKKSGKMMFVLFTGSDWCRWCIKLEDEILSKPEFAKAVGEQYVFVKIDSPRKHPLPEKEEARNEELLDQYDIEGYPTILLVDSKEEVDAELSYVSGGVAPFLAELKSVTDPTQSADAL